MGFKGKIKIYEKDEHGDFTKFIRESPNLFVDDGKELTLDYLWGLVSWWNPMEQNLYGSGNVGWDTKRYMGFGTCMFNNASFERASGWEGIPSGNEYDYPVDATYLVSPEDSFLSKETGTRILVDATRTDQTVEIAITVTVPGYLTAGTKLREFGMFLKSAGPNHDPSLVDNQKPYSIVCRSVISGSGWYNSLGPCAKTDPGAKLCYFDDPYEVNDDIQLRWVFGEL